MNLQPISPPDKHGQYVLCCCCSHMAPLAECKADIDGPAFVAYYCLECQKIAPHCNTLAD